MHDITARHARAAADGAVARDRIGGAASPGAGHNRRAHVGHDVDALSFAYRVSGTGKSGGETGCIARRMIETLRSANTAGTPDCWLAESELSDLHRAWSKNRTLAVIRKQMCRSEPEISDDESSWAGFGS